MDDKLHNLMVKEYRIAMEVWKCEMLYYNATHFRTTDRGALRLGRFMIWRTVNSLEYLFLFSGGISDRPTTGRNYIGLADMGELFLDGHRYLNKFERGGGYLREQIVIVIWQIWPRTVEIWHKVGCQFHQHQDIHQFLWKVWLAKFGQSDQDIVTNIVKVSESWDNYPLSF